MKTRWRLPHGVDELLPPAAWELEQLRRKVLDVFDGWGYDYIEPPVIEYLDSLLVGSGEDLDLQTLKVIDQLSGRQLGVRADMTSQAVRIDAHSLEKEGVQRLCYAGPVVFAQPQLAQTSRVPYKAGAEIFGSSSLEADAEIVGLMSRVVHLTADNETDQPVLLLGHMGIYRGLVAALLAEGVLAPGDEWALFNKIQRKSASDIHMLLDESPLADMMAELPGLMGGSDVLDRARKALAHAPGEAQDALSELADLVELVGRTNGGMQVRLDISELSGYGYHNGPVFAVYHPRHGQALAQGGRYDGVGEVFGRARPATGFDVNLKSLIGTTGAVRDCVFAPMVPADARPALLDRIAALRSEGVRVQCALDTDETPPAGCRRQLVLVDGDWQIQTLPGN